jgi:hypothetical protein
LKKLTVAEKCASIRRLFTVMRYALLDCHPPNRSSKSSISDRNGERSLLNVSEARIRYRQIRDDDISAVVELLNKGFPERGRDYWARGLARQARRPIPDGIPRYGYLLENAAVPVGVILVLHMTGPPGDEAACRCNLSGWYVEPAFRSHAALLISFAIRRKEVTYININPEKHTWPIVEAQGFTRYSNGWFITAAALSRAEPGVRLVEIASEGSPAALPEAKLLSDHADYGCLSLVCIAADGAYPFVFRRIVKGRRIRPPGAKLVYCRSIEDFVRFAGVLGRFLLKRGMLFVAVDANDRIQGLIGTSRLSRGRKYFKGPHPPRQGDLSYTELAIFGP